MWLLAFSSCHGQTFFSTPHPDRLPYLTFSFRLGTRCPFAVSKVAGRWSIVLRVIQCGDWQYMEINSAFPSVNCVGLQDADSVPKESVIHWLHLLQFEVFQAVALQKLKRYKCCRSLVSTTNSATAGNTSLLSRACLVAPLPRAGLVAPLQRAVIWVVCCSF